MQIEDKFAFIGSDIFRFKRSTDARLASVERLNLNILCIISAKNFKLVQNI